VFVVRRGTVGRYGLTGNTGAPGCVTATLAACRVTWPSGWLGFGVELVLQMELLVHAVLRAIEGSEEEFMVV
jgi:hypothetical protein